MLSTFAGFIDLTERLNLQEVLRLRRTFFMTQEKQVYSVLKWNVYILKRSNTGCEKAILAQIETGRSSRDADLQCAERYPNSKWNWQNLKRSNTGCGKAIQTQNETGRTSRETGLQCAERVSKLKMKLADPQEKQYRVRKGYPDKADESFQYYLSTLLVNNKILYIFRHYLAWMKVCDHFLTFSTLFFKMWFSHAVP